MEHGWNYCTRCGNKIAFSAIQCPQCGHETPRAKQHVDTSPKSYGTAVALCGVFGIVGVHHFYIGNIVHGLIDLGLLVATVILFMAGTKPGSEYLIGFAFLCLMVDIIHTVVVFIMLIIGKQRDGSGRVIRVP